MGRAPLARFALRERTAASRDRRLLLRAWRAPLARTVWLDATRRAGAACVQLAAFLLRAAARVRRAVRVLEAGTVWLVAETAVAVGSAQREVSLLLEVG